MCALNPAVPSSEFSPHRGEIDISAASRVGQAGLSATAELPARFNPEYVNAAFINELERENTPEAHGVSALLKALPVENEINIDRQHFYLSGIVSAGGKRHCVGYVHQEDGRLTPRLFYRSDSEGDWRVAPWIEPVEGYEEMRWHFSKGEKFEGGYVRETRLVNPLRSELNAAEERGIINWDRSGAHWLYNRFTNTMLGSRGEESYMQIADETRVRGMPAEAFRFLPGHGFETERGEQPAREQLAQLELPEHLMPNFSEVHSEGSFTHPRLGKVNQVAFKTNRGTMAWHFCYDDKGRVWPAGLTGTTDPPNSYGVSDEVTLTGVFDNKPLEYRLQIEGLVEGVDYRQMDKLYVDITPLLANLPLVKAFKQHFGTDPHPYGRHAFRPVA
jgi:hypothetical protein